MQLLEGSGTPVLYTGRTVLKELLSDKRKQKKAIMLPVTCVPLSVVRCTTLITVAIVHRWTARIQRANKSRGDQVRWRCGIVHIHFFARVNYISIMKPNLT